MAWLYVAEVTVDAASGFSAAAKFINLMIISFTFEYMLNSPLKVHGAIWYFGAMTILGFFFCLCFVRETRGLTDLEKKMLYSPKSILDEQIMEIQRKQKQKDKTQNIIDIE